MGTEPLPPHARRREARLREVVRAQRRFIEMLAHDVRSPVSAAVLRTQALALRADDETRAALAAMEDMLQDLSRSVGTLVEGMRILSGAPRLDRCPVDASDVMQRAVASVRRRAERRHIRLEHDGGAPAVLAADPDQLEALIMWMAAVCIRLTRSGGTVHLGLGSDERTVGVRVESFDSLADADTLAVARRDFLGGRTGEGTDVTVGFGVAVAKRLATRHGGRLTIDDDGQPPGRCRLRLLAQLPRTALGSTAGSSIASADA